MPYHKYVFDEKNRTFVGKFEEMYRQEETEGFDSWKQESFSLIDWISLCILNRYNFNNVLDVGCGKGKFTHLLKKANNRVTGIDLSETAIKKARWTYQDITFLVIDALKIKEALPNEHFDLIVSRELLSYLQGWKEFLKITADMTSYIFITLYLPKNPIGFVQSFDELRQEVSKHYNIETEVLINNSIICILAHR